MMHDLSSPSPAEKPEPDESNGFLPDHVALLLASFRRLLGRPLLDEGRDPVATARALYEADFVVVSHGTESDPVFNYANRCAQRRFELDWQRFVQLPSRLSVEAGAQEAREALMAKVRESGFIEGYAGTRISASGTRFPIANAIIWNLYDEAGTYRGQAATFPA